MVILSRRDVDGVAVLTISTPDRSVNVVDSALFRELEAVCNDTAADDSVTAMVLVSGKSSGFGVGADVEWVTQLAVVPDGPKEVMAVHRLMAQLYLSDKPLVTAIAGRALGGALELALASRALLAGPESTLGFPEVLLGLMPGGGATVFLPRLIDPGRAVDLLTSGRTIGSSEAADLGLVTTVEDTEGLERRAVDLARGVVGGEGPAPWPRRPDIVAAADALTRRGGDAVERILASVRYGAEHSLGEALDEERRLFFEQIRSAEAASGIHLFIVERELKRLASSAPGDISAVGVVGGGQMGTGIAAAAVTQGLDVWLREVDQGSLDRAGSVLDRAVASIAPGRMAGSWRVGQSWEGFGNCDLVVEAVFESMELKLEVLADMSARCRPDTLLASNTSALSITDLAGAVAGPHRFLGMHFFSPVERMRLVEMIPHPGTSADCIKAAHAAARTMGKVPVLVADSPGFFTSRVYARWLAEAVILLVEGCSPDVIDTAAREAGFAAGPMVGIDEATVDLVLAASVAQVVETLMTDRARSTVVRGALMALQAGGMRGRRHGRGLYLYDSDGRRVGPNPEALQAVGAPSAVVPDEEIASRLLLAFVSEALLCWDVGILCHPDDGDFAAVAGIGFPRRLGGPFRFVDEQGPAEIVAALQRAGARFPTGTVLPEIAASGGSYSAMTRSVMPPLTARGRE